MIELSNINLSFSKNTPQERVIFQDFNLQVNPQEFLTLIGDNGAGKSTLLKIISGDLKIDSGKIIIDEIDVTNLPRHYRAQYIARVTQDPHSAMCAQFSIAENMSIALSRGKTRWLKFALNKSKNKIFKEALSLLGIGLENRLNDKVSNLSGGQVQALNLVMATLSSAKLLLLDEHTAALDPKMAESTMELTKKLHIHHNLTILMITHNLKFASSYGNRLLSLTSGKITKDSLIEV